MNTDLLLDKKESKNVWDISQWAEYLPSVD